MSPDKKLSWSRELGVRCSECGQFLSLVDQAIIAARYTPDTPWTSERMDFRHRQCLLLDSIPTLSGGGA